MGQSTNAILAFGFNLDGADDELPEKLATACDDGDGYIDFEQLVLAEVGLEAPAHQNYEAPEWAAYWKAKNAAVESFPVTIEHHCHHEYTMYFLAIQGTVTTAHRGSPEAVEFPTISPEQIQALRDFCERYDIEWTEPKWHIFSYWG